MKKDYMPSLFPGKQSKQTYIFSYLFWLYLWMCITLIMSPLKSGSQKRAQHLTLTNAKYSRATPVSHALDSLPLLAQPKHGRKEAR